MNITWHSPTEGRHNGTIGCSNGHVHLRDVLPKRQREHEDAVRELSNALERDPGTMQQAETFLTALGAKKIKMGNHSAFSALPDEWPAKLEDAIKAVSKAPAPKEEPKTLEELKAAHPDLLKQHAEEVISELAGATASEEIKDLTDQVTELQGSSNEGNGSEQNNGSKDDEDKND